MIVEFEGYRPQVSPTAFVAPTAVLVGNVMVQDEASVWYDAVLRANHGDQTIVVGARSSVQDNCVIHVALDHGTTIGEDVTVGHGAMLEGCDVDHGATALNLQGPAQDDTHAAVDSRHVFHVDGVSRLVSNLTMLSPDLTKYR